MCEVWLVNTSGRRTELLSMAVEDKEKDGQSRSWEQEEEGKCQVLHWQTLCALSKSSADVCSLWEINVKLHVIITVAVNLILLNETILDLK